MADADVRALERRWREAPWDQDALAALVGALRRAGRAVPAELVDARLLPARTIRTSWKYRVGAVLPSGERVDLGTTRRGEELEIPACRWWWLELPTNVDPRERGFGARLRDATELGPPGLQLSVTGRRGIGDRLADFASLERLKLVGHGWVDDDDIGALCRLPDLVDLELSECALLSSMALAHIGKMSRLVRLVLDRCHGIDDQGLDALNDLTSLTTLDLRRTSVGGRGLRRLRLPHLRHLGLRACPIEEVAVEQLDALEEIDLMWCNRRFHVRARDGIRVRRRDPRVRLDWLHGVCPVQGGGEIDGAEFYFRARGRHWSFTVGPDDAPLFDVEEEWGDGPYDAGYMDLEEAERLIQRCADEFLGRAGSSLA